jgi:hypothetical protein
MVAAWWRPTAAPGFMKACMGRTPPRSRLTVVRPPIGGRMHRRGGPRWHHRPPLIARPATARSVAVGRVWEESERRNAGSRVLLNSLPGFVRTEKPCGRWISMDGQWWLDRREQPSWVGAYSRSMPMTWLGVRGAVRRVRKGCGLFYRAGLGRFLDEQ